MESETSRTIRRHKVEEDNWRRRCGCLRTSEKLKQIINTFPPPPPPTPDFKDMNSSPIGNTCISAFCTVHQPSPAYNSEKICCDQLEELIDEPKKKFNQQTSCDRWNLNGSELLSLHVFLFMIWEKCFKGSNKWRLLTELAHIIQMSVTATALAIYYVIYCYMQLIYYTLRSALYFHNADGPMKITIAVVTVTSLIVAINVLLKIEKIIRFY